MDYNRIPWGRSNPIDRNDLVIPELMLEELNDDPAKVMKPIFDAVWNASGWPRCMNYDNDGNRLTVR